MTAERSELHQELKRLEREIAVVKCRLFSHECPTDIHSNPKLHSRLDSLIARHARIQQKLQEEGK